MSAVGFCKQGQTQIDWLGWGSKRLPDYHIPSIMSVSFRVHLLSALRGHVASSPGKGPGRIALKSKLTERLSHRLTLLEVDRLDIVAGGVSIHRKVL